MKLAQRLVIAAIVATPALSFAQSSQPVTRNQVRQELIELQKNGYVPSSDQTQYPKNIEAALERIRVKSQATATSPGRSVAASSTAIQTEQSGTSRIGVSPKTRSDVLRELAQAQQDGQLAKLRRLYHGN
ncbi:uncharacterized protein DUF4148 [Paraburkholderia sp. BL6669N2]|uniref:DUF4148 domain-containing protein n=1 Tax=Paraburkholderia sp. BL6669N2 TaxID=1938807 RepID=UPI000E23F8AF|nr:DUF4148 domain-containing protein [Paraburkholderia sp. BL6669N2]REG45503.1 uncharacterized protein DUF4148 [Paraburkholderia sp. BL6669N2]